MNVLTSILLIFAAGLTLAWLVAAQRRLVARPSRPTTFPLVLIGCREVAP